MIIVNCDGGSRGNPGRAAIGIVIRDGEKVIKKHKEVIENTTNNVAEYNSLIKALELVKKYGSEINVFMDSELVINQMNGRYRVKAQHLIPLYFTAKEFEKDFKKVVYNHVLREDKFQAMADELVNEALDEKTKS